MKQTNNPRPRYHYYPAKNAKADIFFEIQYLARQSQCDRFRKIATKPVVDKGYGVTIDGRFHQQVVTRFYPARRDGVIKAIRQGLRDGSGFQLSVEEWEHLEDLVSTYEGITGERITIEQWRQVKEVMNRHRHFYDPEPIQFRS